MSIAVNIIGWIAWSFVVFLTLSYVRGFRLYARSGQPFSFMTGLQTLLLYTVAFIFLFSQASKLHILWILLLIYFRPLLFYLQYAPLMIFFVRLLVRISIIDVKCPVTKRDILQLPTPNGLSTPISVLLKAEWVRIQSIFSRD